MRFIGIEVALCGTWALCAAAQTPIDIQQVKKLKPDGTLATCSYTPIASEVPYFSRLSNDEKTNEATFGSYSINDKMGIYVSWFGIVRGIAASTQPDGEVTLLLQHHYFDGMTDCHIMLVGKTGDGDFEAKLKVDPAKLPALALVRVYGKVVSENAGIPEVAVDYIRVWPWMTFTFTDLAGPDHSNPRWWQAAHVKPGDQMYVPYPDESYYRKVLGDPAEFGVNLKTNEATVR
jgi:hypothetical protein